VGGGSDRIAAVPKGHPLAAKKRGFDQVGQDTVFYHAASLGLG
jgi:hypothetical protein